jgi:hypothetical protein
MGPWQGARGRAILAAGLAEPHHGTAAADRHAPLPLEQGSPTRASERPPRRLGPAVALLSQRSSFCLPQLARSSTLSARCAALPEAEELLCSTAGRHASAAPTSVRFPCTV